MRFAQPVFVFVLVSSFLVASGNTIPVGASEKITTIRQAIRDAAPGDTLLIMPGLYKEGNLVIEKPLSIFGQGGAVIDGQNQYELFTIHADHVTIQGLDLRNTGVASINDIAAIKVFDSKFIRVANNRLQNTFFGVHCSNSSHLWVENNTLSSHAETEHKIGNGIHMWKCHHVTINNNAVSGHRDGYYFEFVTNSLITNNLSTGNMRYGLHFMFSHNNEYRNNTFAGNGAGVAVMYTTGVKMIDNVFEKNWGSSAYGLLLKDIRDSEVRDNKFISNSVAIHMEGSSRIEFEHNTFYQNGYGIKLHASCDDNKFFHNNFIANTFDMATNGTLVLNEVDNNYWDRYEGYDLNKDQIGDVPYHPISMYSMVVEQMPTAVLLWRSFLVFLMDRAEKAIPAITPENLKDNTPLMKPYDYDKPGEQVVWQTTGS